MPQNVIAYLLSHDASELKFLEGFDLCQSINEAQKQLPVGVYTTFRTYQKTKALNLDDHFSRLTESSMLLGYSVSLDRVKIRKSIRSILDRINFPENRIRLSLDLSIFPGYLYIFVESLTIPDDKEYALGVRVCTRELHRDHPKVKSTEFIELADRQRRSLTPGVNEIIMIGSGGRLLEGLSSNFFAIKSGVIWTEEENVLSGVTRKIVLALMGELGIEGCFGGFSPARERSDRRGVSDKR